MNAAQPFFWGSGGRRLTPEEVLLERKNAQALGQEAMSTAPIGHWSQGLNRIVQGLMAGYDDYRAGDASRQNATESGAVIQALLGGGGAAPAAATTAPALVPAMAPGPAAPATVQAGVTDQGLAEAITQAATARGVDPQYMTRLAMVESNGNINAANPNSSARGPFQFINSTAKQYGLANPTDPVASADAAARLTLDNKAALTSALGREPTPGELYLAHQQGAGGATKLLANPNTPVEAVIGPEAARLNGAQPGMTAGQFAQKWTGRFGDPGAAAQGVPQAAAAPVAATGAPQINPAIVKALSSPYVSDQARKIGGMLFQNHLEQQTKANDPLRRMQIQEMQGKLGMMPLELRGKELANTKAERELLGEGAQPLTPAERASFGIPDGQPAYKTRSGEIKFGPAGTKITNTVGDTENAFAKEAGKATATRFNDLVADGQQARQVSADVSTLRDLGKAIGTGKGAQAKAMLGPYADALGIKIEGLGNIQAYEAIVNRVAPSLRVKGAGSQSDFELKNFLKSLPSLGNTPEGNDIAAVVMEGLQQNKVLASEIASKALSGEISRGDAEKQLRNLPDPMTPYREYTAKRSKVDSLVDKYGAR